MDYRYLGRSGLKISELTYGKLADARLPGGERRRHRMRAGRPGRRDHLVRHRRRLRQHRRPRRCWARAAGQRRESLEIFTKVYWPTGRAAPNDSGLSRKHIMESINGSLRRLRTDYVDLYQAHRYDTETPLEETMLAFADVVRAGKALYIGVSEWTADQIRAGHALAASSAST
jgi:aryl-alcohol dehydrogenase-like predicted oxidoreductase